MKNLSPPGSLLTYTFWLWIILLGTIILGSFVGRHQLEDSLFVVLWILWSITTLVMLVLGIPWVRNQLKQ